MGGVCVVVAECVGKLTLVDPQTLLGKLQVRLRGGVCVVQGKCILKKKGC